jgi:hypothetical protein
MRQSTELLDDPVRCIHIGDRESDIYELFCTAYDLSTYFLVRTCVDRLAGDGQHTISKAMRQVQVKGLHRVELRDAKGRPMTATLELRYAPMTVLPPIGKQSRYPALQLTVLHAQERDPPAGRARIEWKLITNLPVGSRAEAIEKLDWYAMHWKIETFHKILKSGCKAEESRLRTADRLTNLIAVFCIRHLFQISLAQPIGHVPVHAHQHDIEPIVQSLQNLRNSWCKGRSWRRCLLHHRVSAGSSDAHSSVPALMRHNRTNGLRGVTRQRSDTRSGLEPIQR